jgi:hypothetical protein
LGTATAARQVGSNAPPPPPPRCVWLNYYALFGTPVLVALNAAETAADLEARGDDDVVSEALEVGGGSGCGTG